MVLTFVAGVIEKQDVGGIRQLAYSFSTIDV